MNMAKNNENMRMMVERKVEAAGANIRQSQQTSVSTMSKLLAVSRLIRPLV